MKLSSEYQQEFHPEASVDQKSRLHEDEHSSPSTYDKQKSADKEEGPVSVQHPEFEGSKQASPSIHYSNQVEVGEHL